MPEHKTTNLSPDFREFIGSLNETEARYLVVGGYAVAFHGHPRYTKDLDIWIEADDVNAARVVQAIETFGFGGLGIQKGDFLVEDQIIQLGLPPNRIDLLTSVPGVEFDDCYRRKVVVMLAGTAVHFIDLQGLRAAKLASGRHQDLADLEQLPAPSQD